jgi:hypothetical protein
MEHKENIWQFVKRRGDNVARSIRSLPHGSSPRRSGAAGKIGLDRLSGPPATAARPAFHRQRVLDPSSGAELLP